MVTLKKIFPKKLGERTEKQGSKLKPYFCTRLICTVLYALHFEWMLKSLYGLFFSFDYVSIHTLWMIKKNISCLCNFKETVSRDLRFQDILINHLAPGGWFIPAVLVSRRYSKLTTKGALTVSKTPARLTSIAANIRNSP